MLKSKKEILLGAGIFLFLFSLVCIWLYFLTLSNNSIIRDKDMLFNFTSSLGYSAKDSIFQHEKASWTNIESNHDYMLIYIKTNETADEITRRLTERKVSFNVPKTMDGTRYVNYWVVQYESNSIIVQLKPELTLSASLGGEVAETNEPRYLELYYTRR